MLLIWIDDTVKITTGAWYDFYLTLKDFDGNRDLSQVCNSDAKHEANRNWIKCKKSSVNENFL